MKRWHPLLPNWAVLTLLGLLITLNLCFSFYGFSFLSNIIVLSVIPMLLMVYFAKQKRMAHTFFVLFTLYYLGIIFSLLDQLSLSAKLSEFCFLTVYALAIGIMLSKLKHVKFEGLISVYLIVALLINTYLMYMMFTVVKDSFEDSVILVLTVSKGIAILVMGFLAFAIYLSRETSQSILFLAIICFFGFADVLSFITTLYINFWIFESFQHILQAAALLLFCFYVYNSQEHSKIEEVVEQAHSPSEALHA